VSGVFKDWALDLIKSTCAVRKLVYLLFFPLRDRMRSRFDGPESKYCCLEQGPVYTPEENGWTPVICRREKGAREARD
jgi:hypothetical protein